VDATLPMLTAVTPTKVAPSSSRRSFIFGLLALVCVGGGVVAYVSHRTSGPPPVVTISETTTSSASVSVIAPLAQNPTAEPAAGRCSTAVECLQACDDGSSAACFALGSMYDSGIGVATDKVKAGTFYKRACDLGHAQACKRLPAASASASTSTVPTAPTVAWKPPIPTKTTAAVPETTATAPPPPEPTSVETKPSATTELATLKINSIPPSTVFLDGVEIGQTPRMGVSVTPGAHVVQFKNPTYGSKTVSVVVAAGETRLVAVKLSN
jgi:hypothetical protein